MKYFYIIYKPLIGNMNLSFDKSSVNNQKEIAASSSHRDEPWLFLMKPSCSWTVLQLSDLHDVSVKQCDSNEKVRTESHSGFVLIEFHHGELLAVDVCSRRSLGHTLNRL